MSAKAEESIPSVRTKMESLRLTCDAELLVQQQKMDAFTASFRKSLESAKARAHETAKYQAQIEEVKGKLREAEDHLVKALAVKTRKEAKRMALMDAIASSKSRVENLKRSFQEQRTKRDQYAAIISQQSLASEGKTNEGLEHKDERQEAISWYNSVLGFHVEGGRGVKFTFKNISLNNPNEEYSFTIRHENDTYTLLNCEPSLKDTKELIYELNKTNGLFKFVRVMRQKFQEAAAKGSLALITSDHQESAFISASAPVSSMSPSTCDSTTKKNENQVQPREGNRHFKKQNLGRTVRSTVLSPGSASSVRQSPRLKARK
ncbi:hypothetical protein L6164_014750 [Bauhinia variegata]|uniref:Uncharacterized protein n=1 Tax=Bauhinia variegata TaxID=167791 RepID=A0ACB9NJ77_BAUVA|nr:hypothetical protein L6164_014750 [Bauhinia variegata]